MKTKKPNQAPRMTQMWLPPRELVRELFLMEMMMKTKRILIAEVDIGKWSPPGGDVTKVECRIYTLPSGRIEAEGEVKLGSNQGFFDCNYSHGPWRGRAETAKAAVSAMVARAESDYQDDMRRAGHDALLKYEDKTED